MPLPHEGAVVILEDGIRSHPKIVQAGAEAAWLWVCAIDYSRDHLTDGFVPEAALGTLGVFKVAPRKLADVLVRERLFDVVEGGYHVHDYLDKNDPAEKVKAKRQRDKDRKAAERAEADARRESSSGRPSRVRDLSAGIHDGQKDARAIARERVGVGVGTGSGQISDLDLREEREKGAAEGLFGDDVWTAWREAGARHGHDRIEANPSVANWSKHLATIRRVVHDADELEAALDCWWASPFITAGRNVGLFASALPEVLAHLAAGHTHLFRDPHPPAAPVARRFCDHEPECTTWREHQCRQIDARRAAEGLAPHAVDGMAS